MFGSKKKVNQEEFEKLEADIISYQKEVYAVKTQFEECYQLNNESHTQAKKDIEQTLENSATVTEIATDNVSSMQNFNNRLDELRTALVRAEGDYAKICDRIKDQNEACMQVVEQNKHYTTPSKYLCELPEELRNINKEYLDDLSAMNSCGRQMGIVALNAAIEAGRLGEAGKNFVSAAEEVRTLSKDFETAATALSEKVKNSEEKIAELEERVKSLVALLKENNIATGRLLRDSSDLEQLVEKSAMKEFSVEISSYKEDMTAMKKQAEELLKAEERNRFQLSDIAMEQANQSLRESEMKSAWEKLTFDKLLEEEESTQ